MAAPDLSGHTLAGRYDILALLGSGGMGAVYRAHDRELDELVALKVIRADLAHDPAMVDRFRHEVKLARRVTHINIARTFELGIVDGVMFCTMELIAGESLRARLQRDGSVPIAHAAAIARELCDGLAAAHAAAVIHRDIKPDNVLLANDGRVVLADFGVAALTLGHHGGDSMGTPRYMAPEQALGEPPTAAADVYAVGVLLYEMVTGLPAFAGSVAEIMIAKQETERLTLELADVLAPHAVPVELAQIIGRATARDLDERIASADELARSLAPFTRDAPASPADMRGSDSDDSSLHVVVVLAPRAERDDARLHIAEGVHEELLRRLVAKPRVRVWPRTPGTEVPDATMIELRAGHELAVAIRRDGSETTLQLPLEVARIGMAADAIASAVTATLETSPDAAVADEVRALVLRARMLAHRGFAGVAPANELLERAHALRPNDARVAAFLAMLRVRYALLGAGQQDFEPVRELVTAALAAAPRLSESHVAAGHLELHTGDAGIAAGHFRTAIACSPYIAEGHEGIGRLLLEAGFLDVGLARLEDALAISPELASVRWEIARAHALEHNWYVYDELVDELRRSGDRAIVRMRVAVWRNDRATLDELRAAFEATPFEQNLLKLYGAMVLGVARWSDIRDAVIAHIRAVDSPSRRRHALVAQLGAEAAGVGGDSDTCQALIEHATHHGLFDLHWLDRCPLLEVARGTPRWDAARARVKQVADAILDALYGDHDVGTVLSDTIHATRSPPTRR